MYRSSKEYKIKTKFKRDLAYPVKHSEFRHSSFCPSGVKHDCGFGILVAKLVFLWIEGALQAWKVDQRGSTFSAVTQSCLLDIAE